MATGIPLQLHKREGVHGRYTLSSTHKSDSCLSLSYDGKSTEQAVLAAKPAEIRTIWQEGTADQVRSGNRLYYGDNLPILARLLHDPDVLGRVRLVYIDPPFATQSVFRSRSQNDAYSDYLSGAPYIEFLRQRLILLRELMADDASIYVHLDDKMAFYVKVVMDEVFGLDNFRNWITRKKCNPKNYTSKSYGNISDFVLFYTKSEKYVWNRPYAEWTDERAQEEYSYVEEETNRRYKKVPLHAPGVRNGETGKAWRGMLPPQGKHWQFSPKTLDEMDARGDIYWSPNGNPRRKIYLENSAGIPVQDIWLDVRDAHNQNIAITGYPTEKNPDLLARVIRASSNPGDLVLDCFCGSGTTLAVSSQLNRQWVGIDSGSEAIATTLRRFAKGLERMGDFVQRESPRDHGIQARLPLLDVGQPTVQDKAGTNGHSVIRDFTLCAEEALTAELEAVVAQWREWIRPTMAGQ